MPKKSASSKVVEVIGWGGRTAAYRWLWTHYDRIVAAKIGSRYRWGEAAAEMERLGIVKSAPTADALRKTFERVHADKQKAAAKEPKQQAMARVSAQERILPVSPERPMAEPLEDEDDFKPVAEKR